MPRRRDNAVRYAGFTGMNNVKAAEGALEEPRVILNADVTDEGRIIKRAGYAQYIDIAGPHSLFAWEDVMLFAAGGKLYRAANGAAVEIGDVDGPDARLYYCVFDGKIFVSNRHWRRRFDPADNSLTDWGMDTPEAPTLGTATGNLPAGRYHVCLTRVDGARMSGSSPITPIDILSGGGGIAVSGRSAGELVWCTDPNGSELCRVGYVDAITAAPPTAEVMPCLWCGPPPNLEHTCAAFGRIWGASGKYLYYSEPFYPEWFATKFRFFRFEQDVTMASACIGGMYIGTEDAVYFLEGGDPDQARQRYAGPGAIAGSAGYAPDLGELGKDIPVWLTDNGMFAGGHDGTTINLTRSRLKLAPGKTGAVLAHQTDGALHMLASWKGGHSAVGMSDAATVEVIRNGSVI